MNRNATTCPVALMTLTLLVVGAMSGCTKSGQEDTGRRVDAVGPGSEDPNKTVGSFSSEPQGCEAWGHIAEHQFDTSTYGDGSKLLPSFPMPEGSVLDCATNRPATERWRLPVADSEVAALVDQYPAEPENITPNLGRKFPVTIPSGLYDSDASDKDRPRSVDLWVEHYSVPGGTGLTFFVMS